MSDDTQWRTHRGELDDQTLREWESAVLAADAEEIVLDRSAFYPGGGDPVHPTTASCSGAATRRPGTWVRARAMTWLYLIPAEGDPLPAQGTAVRERRRRSRRAGPAVRTHSGLCILCGVVFRDFGALVTGGNME